jgi:hypothetical protein
VEVAPTAVEAVALTVLVEDREVLEAAEVLITPKELQDKDLLVVLVLLVLEMLLEVAVELVVLVGTLQALPRELVVLE